jgi:hypothetical protein
VTPETLIETIRQVPGINRVRRWRMYGNDRLYVHFSVSMPAAETFVDLKCGVLFGYTGQWEYDPHNLGERALRTIRELCELYRRERQEETA